MLFKDVINGNCFFFGHGKDCKLRKWMKIHDDFAICIDNNLIMPFDEKSSNFFFDSTIYKYLNCKDKSWSTHNKINETENDVENGFLSSFTEDELKNIEPYDLEIIIPSSKIKLHKQNVVTKSVLVGLPTAEMIKSDFDIFLQSCPTWVSNYYFDVKSAYYDHPKVYAIDPNSSRFFIPIIHINEEASLEAKRYGWQMMPFVTDFNGDLSTFLGM